MKQMFIALGLVFTMTVAATAQEGDAGSILAQTDTVAVQETQESLSDVAAPEPVQAFEAVQPIAGGQAMVGEMQMGQMVADPYMNQSVYAAPATQVMGSPMMGMSGDCGCAPAYNNYSYNNCGCNTVGTYAATPCYSNYNSCGTVNYCNTGCNYSCNTGCYNTCNTRCYNPCQRSCNPCQRQRSSGFNFGCRSRCNPCQDSCSRRARIIRPRRCGCFCR
ncbi:MAG: hypothetical protein AAF456_21610 [Planctomycetota bacterium]